MESRYYRYTVIPQEIDFTGKARFSTVVNAILNTAGEDARVNGFGIDVLSEMNLGWVLSRLAVELDRRPLEQEEYTVETWITEYAPLTTTRCFRFLDSKGNCFGRSVSTWCLIDFARRRPAPMATIAESAGHTITDKPLPCAAPVKLKPFDAEPCASHKVKYMDIDFNRHMNTLRYIDLLTDELPIELVAADRPIRVDVHFVKESVYGDVLNIFSIPEDDSPAVGYRMAIKKEDGTLGILARIESAVCFAERPSVETVRRETAL